MTTTALTAERSLLREYLADAAGWDADRVTLARRSERRAWIVAGGSALLALCLGGALFALTPFKQVQPYVIRVDNGSGIVDVVPAYDGRAEVSDLVHRYFLGQYVRLRERFNQASAEQDYYEVAALSGPVVGQEWIGLWQRGNAASPLERFRDGTTVRVEVRSVTFFERGSGAKDLAQVRFARMQKSATGAAEVPSYFIATIQFAYGKPSTDPQQRQWNPLGFRVIDYKVDPEVAPDVSPGGNGGSGGSGSASLGSGGRS